MRLLAPLSEGAQRFWEVLNYVLALLALLGIGVVWGLRRRSEQPMALVREASADLPSAQEGKR